jgi:hypothetical protein
MQVDNQTDLGNPVLLGPAGTLLSRRPAAASAAPTAAVAAEPASPHAAVAGSEDEAEAEGEALLVRVRQVGGLGS